MSGNDVHRKAIELLLSSIFQKNDEGLKASFFFGRPGAARWDRHMGTEIYYGRKPLIRTALFVRQMGPAYLKYLPIGTIWSMLQDFVIESYWYLVDETWFRRFEGTFDEHVSEETKRALAEALAQSAIFVPRNSLTVFPLVAVQVKADFSSGPLLVVKPESLSDHLPLGVERRWIAAGQFPPSADWKGRKEIPSAWLGIRSADPMVSSKLRAAALGAFALIPLRRYRYMFSGRRVFGGQCTIAPDGIETAFGEAHVPPLVHDIVIESEDLRWLKVLSDKLGSSERSVRNQLRALEYFYRAWRLNPPERFPVLCMALDAVFGDANHTTQAVIDSVRGVLGTHINEARLRQLMELRGSVIHGGAPDVYDSSKYGRYYEDYGDDPIGDLELLVAAALRARVFDDTLVEHADPNAEMIAKAQAEGRLPRTLVQPSILDVPD